MTRPTHDLLSAAHPPLLSATVHPAPALTAAKVSRQVPTPAVVKATATRAAPADRSTTDPPSGEHMRPTSYVIPQSPVARLGQRPPMTDLDGRRHQLERYAPSPAFILPSPERSRTPPSSRPPCLRWQPHTTPLSTPTGGRPHPLLSAEHPAQRPPSLPSSLSIPTNPPAFERRSPFPRPPFHLPSCTTLSSPFILDDHLHIHPCHGHENHRAPTILHPTDVRPTTPPPYLRAAASRPHHLSFATSVE